jgi:branched-chain amino acid transport system permease protein
MVSDSSARSLPVRLAADTRLFYLLPVLALFVPLFTNPYTQFVVNLMLIYVLVAVGFNIVIGNLGQLAFANTAFFGIGAYATGLLMADAGLPFWAALIPGGAMGALAGFLASVTALRGIRIYYLAIVTLAFGELMRWVYIHAEGITRGTDGLPVPMPTVFGMSLDTEVKKFYVFLAIAFVWSGFVVGIAGGMFAILIGRVVPDSFGLIELIFHFAMVMVGGFGSLSGSVLGAIVLTAVPEYFRSFPGLEEMFFGVLLVLVLMFLPKGLASFFARYLPMFRQRFYRK